MITIKTLREKKGLSQRQLAEAIGVKQATVSRWEVNPKKISGENLVKLARYFKVSSDYILGLEQEK